MRLDKYLSSMGICSRRDAAVAVKRGSVTVNGLKPRDSSENVSENDNICYFGERIIFQKTILLMMNKPTGLVCSADDPRDRTIMELLGERDIRAGVFPVGRLDKDTTGFLLLTNDGELCHKLLAPKSHVDKVYLVESDIPFDAGDVAAYAEGVYIERGVKTLPAKLEISADNTREALLTIHEGKFHQIKKMLVAQGKRVTRLERLEFGGVRLDMTLPRGGVRPLTDAEREIILARG